MDELLKNFITKLQTPIKTLWQNNRWFLIGFGLLILIIKFREVIISILISSTHKVFEDAKKKDSELLAQENQAKSQADKLVDDSKKLNDNKSTVDEDWYKNGK